MTGTHRENRRQVTGTRKRSDLCKVQRLDRRVKRERERAREESAFLKETLFRRCALIVANRERNRKREGVDSRRKGRKRYVTTHLSLFSLSRSLRYRSHSRRVSGARVTASFVVPSQPLIYVCVCAFVRMSFFFAATLVSPSHLPLFFFFFLPHFQSRRCVYVRARTCRFFARGRGLPWNRGGRRCGGRKGALSQNDERKRERERELAPGEQAREQEAQGPRSRARIDRPRPHDFHDPSPWPPGHRPKIVSRGVRANRTLTRETTHRDYARRNILAVLAESRDDNTSTSVKNFFL